jgi:NitT/TauT family transport system permease protein
MKRILDVALPIAVALLTLGLWEWAVAHWHVPVYVLPAPSAIIQAFSTNSASLTAALTATFLITIEGFLGALVAATTFAVLFSQNRLIERSLYPYAVILQVTPVVAIAPLILIWVGFDRINLALSLLAGTIAFFPMLSGEAIWRFALANFAEGAVPFCAALSFERHEDGRCHSTDRRSNGGIRGGLRHGNGIGVAYH